MWLFLALVGGGCRSSHGEHAAAAPPSAVTGGTVPSITVPPDSFFTLVRERDRDTAHKF